ncbi:ABC transporter substrate-binding protein [Nocardia sp. SC052]|uniref:ABC transporter substrate-binding protein n=1 Tax=Nocardia sichangensis TaxID=3385975 RepID=UPI0039A16321
MLIDQSNTQGAYDGVVAEYKAAADAVNAAGGVHGRPLELQICDTALNPNTAASCARRAIEAGAPAVMDLSFGATAFTPILQEANIADVGASMTSPAQFTSPISFPLWAGGAGNLVGLGAAAGRLSCQKATMVTDAGAVASAGETAAAAYGAARAAGVDTGDPISAPAGTPDWTSQIATATKAGADCLLLVAMPADVVAQIKAAHTVAPKAKIITLGAQLSEASVKALGSLLDGVNVVNLALPKSAATTDPGVAKWVKETETHSSNRDYGAESANAWAAVKLFADVAARVPEINAKSILDELNQLTDYDPGVFPKVSFASPATNPIGPRLFNSGVVFAHYDGGKLVLDSPTFIDPYTGKTLD